ncbi:hypothetical protein BZG82_06755 [Salinivibrio sp. PR5]|uniref:STAS-like domain-containing protein n=1 Tax=Salinivibrio sp. PR5 TaxID=1909484 RepID=UPI00098AA751|nr:hypothetical protein BZG82_06755 [Salinivibrio sp. PR5]
MTTCLISLPRDFQTLATRKTGQQAREQLLSQLDSNSVVTLDFESSSVSPSFADEFVGLLAQELGLKEFRSRIKMINVSDSSQTIIKHVLRKRLN